MMDSGHDTQILPKCGFMVNKWEWQHAIADDVHLEQEHTESFRNFQTQLTTQRLIGALILMKSRPEKMQRTQGATPDEVTTVVADVHEDVDLYRELCQLGGYWARHARDEEEACDEEGEQPAVDCRR